MSSEIPGSIARLKLNGRNFEIIVDCEKALKFKNGEGNIEDVLIVQEIFKDARKGEVAGNLEEAFGTDDVLEIAKQIIKKGDIQLTEEYRKRALEMKKNRILDEISRNAIDPATKLPIPRQRIELAVEKIGFKFRYDRPVKEQMEELINELKKIMPITLSEIKLLIESPPKHIGHVYTIVKKSAQILDESFMPDGRLIMKIKIPPGIVKDIISKLENISHGTIKIKEVM